MPRLILASTSRYRAELLDRLGLAYDVMDSAADEAAAADETPESLAQRLAGLKAQTVAASLPRPDAVVIGADQTAALDGALLRKPGDARTAFAQLAACRSRCVVFYTAVAIIDCPSATTYRHVDTTEVYFASRTDSELKRYIEREQPFDCAGGFKAERLGISLFEAISSRDPTALIGLPLIWVAATLRQLGLNPLGNDQIID